MIYLALLYLLTCAADIGLSRYLLARVPCVKEQTWLWRKLENRPTALWTTRIVAAGGYAALGYYTADLLGLVGLQVDRWAGAGVLGIGIIWRGAEAADNWLWWRRVR